GAGTAFIFRPFGGWYSEPGLPFTHISAPCWSGPDIVGVMGVEGSVNSSSDRDSFDTSNVLSLARTSPREAVLLKSKGKVLLALAVLCHPEFKPVPKAVRKGEM